MWPDRVLNPGPLTYELGALPTALRGPASTFVFIPLKEGGFPAKLIPKSILVKKVKPHLYFSHRHSISLSSIFTNFKFSNTVFGETIKKYLLFMP